MMRVGVLGANGFIGNRAVEILHASGRYDVRPIVRRASAAALPARFSLRICVADGRDRDALADAFEGCDCVVVSIAGDPTTIVEVIDPIVDASRQAGVRRLVYISTASVHGQSPEEGIDERSSLSSQQPLPYNNAKVEAERRLALHATAGEPEIAVLRPGIVYGPRSQWVGGWADELLSGEAYIVEGAQGVCNAVYVDDVVHAIIRTMDANQVSGAYLIGQKQEVVWRDLYQPIAAALGMSLQDLPDHPAKAARSEAGPSMRQRIAPVLRRVRPLIPAGLRIALRRTGKPRNKRAPVSLERALLHTARHVPAWKRAHEELGYEPQIPFEEGVRRSIQWLAFAGYPVRELQ